METRILTLSDFLEIERVFHASMDAEEQRNIKRGIPNPTSDEQLGKELIAKWFWGIKNWYLNDEDDQHLLFGVLEDNKLLAFVGARLDLPGEYSNGWVVSWLKGDPEINITGNGAIKELWHFMFNYIESLGKTQWHTLVEKGRHSAFDSFGKKLVKEIDDRYEYHTLCEIPRGTKADIDWVYAMMGRQVMDNKDYIVRTGTLRSALK